MCIQSKRCSGVCVYLRCECLALPFWSRREMMASFFLSLAPKWDWSSSHGAPWFNYSFQMDRLRPLIQFYISIIPLAECLRKKGTIAPGTYVFVQNSTKSILGHHWTFKAYVSKNQVSRKIRSGCRVTMILQTLTVLMIEHHYLRIDRIDQRKVGMHLWTLHGERERKRERLRTHW